MTTRDCLALSSFCFFFLLYKNFLYSKILQIGGSVFLEITTKSKFKSFAIFFASIKEYTF